MYRKVGDLTLLQFADTPDSEEQVTIFVNGKVGILYILIYFIIEVDIFFDFTKLSQ